MTTGAPADLRRLVTERAGNRCEYCLFPADESFFTFELEHIISEKHGGRTEPGNLALACPFCNRYKGTDLGSIDPDTGHLTAFFNPRVQAWAEHFRISGAEITPLTPEARVTVAILRLNHPERVQERQLLIELRLYAW